MSKSGRRPRGESKRIRLQKYVASCGWSSRRHAELLIKAGLVLVNGKPAELGSSIDPDTDRVTIHGEDVVAPPLHVIALHKPTGYITAVSDTHDRLTVMDLLPRRLAIAGVMPIGRLDLDSSGLLLFANDGDLAHRIAHPSHSCSKTYMVTVEGDLSDSTAERLSRGVTLDDGPTRPAQVRVIERLRRETRVEFILSEGRKRQVRRMCDAVGHPVLTLTRLAIGLVKLGALPSGAWRELEPSEIASLRNG